MKPAVCTARGRGGPGGSRMRGGGGAHAWDCAAWGSRSARVRRCAGGRSSTRRVWVWPSPSTRRSSPERSGRQPGPRPSARWRRSPPGDAASSPERTRTVPRALACSRWRLPAGPPARPLEHPQLVGVGIAQRPQLIGGDEHQVERQDGELGRHPPGRRRRFRAPTSPSARPISRVIRAKKRSESVSPCTSAAVAPQLGVELVEPFDHAVVGEQPSLLLERMGVRQHQPAGRCVAHVGDERARADRRARPGRTPDPRRRPAAAWRRPGGRARRSCRARCRPARGGSAR